MMNNNIVVIHCLVARLPSATWHLQTPLFVSFSCDVALVVLVVAVVGMGDGCEWQPLVRVMVVVMK